MIFIYLFSRLRQYSGILSLHFSYHVFFFSLLNLFTNDAFGLVRDGSNTELVAGYNG
jgi:hypothetical protein